MPACMVFTKQHSTVQHQGRCYKLLCPLLVLLEQIKTNQAEMQSQVARAKEFQTRQAFFWRQAAHSLGNTIIIGLFCSCPLILNGGVQKQGRRIGKKKRGEKENKARRKQTASQIIKLPLVIHHDTLCIAPSMTSKRFDPANTRTRLTFEREIGRSSAIASTTSEGGAELHVAVRQLLHGLGDTGRLDDAADFHGTDVFD